MALFTEVGLRAQANSELRMASAAQRLRTEARAFDPTQSYDMFLSHAFVDAPLIYAVWKELTAVGFRVYVDWIEDPSDRTNVTLVVADQLRLRMRACASFLYVATDGAGDSAWMPWELGYFDALKQRVAVLPISTVPSDIYKGREYLGLYPYITRDLIEGTGRPAIWIRAAANFNAYVLFHAWLPMNAQPSVRG